MNSDTFHQLVHKVIAQKNAPPEALFAGGFDDWHARARLAHFLAMPSMNMADESIELFRSVVDADYDDEKSEDVEEKAFALQRLSEIECDRQEYETALEHINKAIETVEDTDFLYKYILRGELWAARWNIMHKLGQTDEAEREADDRIKAYEDIPIKYNSYVYYGYRFKAQLSAEAGSILAAKDYMHMALHAMEIPDDYKEPLEKAFSATHQNISWILNDIDHATPNPDQIHWDI